jgi:spore germination protein GerM
MLSTLGVLNYLISYSIALEIMSNKVFIMNEKQQEKQQAPIILSSATASLHEIDLKLLKKYGVKELERMGYAGVLDRLSQTGHIKLSQ